MKGSSPIFGLSSSLSSPPVHVTYAFLLTQTPNSSLFLAGREPLLTTLTGLPPALNPVINILVHRLPTGGQSQLHTGTEFGGHTSLYLS